MANNVPGAVAPDFSKKEIDVPSFVSNNNATQKSCRHSKSTTAEELSEKITEFTKDAFIREKEIVSDLELVLNTIIKYGVPDKIKFSCRMEYDSNNTKKNKVFTIKR